MCGCFTQDGYSKLLYDPLGGTSTTSTPRRSRWSSSAIRGNPTGQPSLRCSCSSSTASRSTTRDVLGVLRVDDALIDEFTLAI